MNPGTFQVAAIEPKSRQRPAKIPSLDGWRALAVILVVLGHANVLHGELAFFGVTVFFFLSGYLITTLMMKEVLATGSIHLGRFYLRRWLRLTPPLAVTVLVTYALAAVGWIPGDRSPMGFASLVGYFHNYYFLAIQSPDSVPLGLGVYWSLGVEQHFYLVLPLLFLAFYNPKSPLAMAKVLAWICVLVLAWRIALTFAWHADFSRIYYASDTRIDSLLFGCVLALWKSPVVEAPVEGVRLAKNRWLLASGAALAMSFLVRWIPFRQTFQFSIQGLALLPLFYFSMRHPTSRWFAVLNAGWMKRLGGLSYSIYLVHCVVLFNLDRVVGSRWLCLILSFAAMFAYAWCMERWVERPFHALRRKLS
jgi:peptidoglycan/LPS O-acetylase OafA/YrhL